MLLHVLYFFENCNSPKGQLCQKSKRAEFRKESSYINKAKLRSQKTDCHFSSRVIALKCARFNKLPLPIFCEKHAFYFLAVPLCVLEAVSLPSSSIFTLLIANMLITLWKRKLELRPASQRPRHARWLTRAVEVAALAMAPQTRLEAKERRRRLNERLKRLEQKQTLMF